MTKRLSELLAENEKLRTQNKRFRELNQDLDQSQESMSKKYATNQKFLRILAQKLRGNDDVLEDALKKYGVELASMQILGGDAKRARFLFMELVKSMAELAGVQAHVAGAVGDKPLSNDVLRLSDEIRKMSVDPYAVEGVCICVVYTHRSSTLALYVLEMTRLIFRKRWKN